MKTSLSSCIPMVPNRILFLIRRYYIGLSLVLKHELHLCLVESQHRKRGGGGVKKAKAVFQRRQREKNRFDWKGNLQDMVCLRSGEGEMTS
jgi:hypothetical protein